MDLRALGVTVDQLSVLVDIVDAGGFTAAARATQRTQGGVSYHVARLEEALELDLFDRTGHRPVLTEAGQAMTDHARRILEALGRLSSTADVLRSGVEARVEVCADVLFAPASVADMLTAFEQRFPHIPLRLTNGRWREPVDALHEGRADLVIAPSIVGADLRSGIVAQVALVPVVASTHPLARVEGPIPLDELRRYRRLVLRTSAELPGESNDAASSSWQLDDTAARRGLLLRGMGWARLVRWQVEDDIEAGRLVMLDLDIWLGQSRVELSAMVDPSRVLGPATQWLYSLLTTQTPTPP
ncbi:MAG: LysR family transcriptional regulator [Myxococcota bacterium]